MAKENFPYQLFIVGAEYSRNDINQRLVNSKVSQQSGVSSFADSLVLFATLEKEDRPEEIQYKDFFKFENKTFSTLEKSRINAVLPAEGHFPIFEKGEFKFFWESQNPTGNFGTPEKPLLSKFLKGVLKGYLFARIEEKTKSKSNPFLYCGSIEPESFDDKANGERPFGVKFSCNDIGPKDVKNDLKILLKWRPKDDSSIKEAEELASSCLANEKAKIKKIDEELFWSSIFFDQNEAVNNIEKKFKKFSLEPSPYIFKKLLEKYCMGLNHGEYLIPEALSGFIIDFLRNLKINSALDPCMRAGALLFRLSKELKVKDINGFEINRNLFQLAKVFNKTATLKNEYFFSSKEFNKKFDLIFASPPMNLRGDDSLNKEIIINNKKLPFNKHAETEIIFSSLQNLSDDGIALFIVSPSFLFKSNRRDVFEFIKEIGFSLEGIFYIPFGTFKPYTAIETRLLVIKKKAQSDFIFEGQLSFNKKRDQNLINNFYSFKEDHDPELGFLRRFKGNVDLKEVIFFEKLSLINKNIDLKVNHLEDISENIIYATYETIDNQNSIFIFLNGNNNVYEYAADIGSKKLSSGIRNRSIAQVVINPEKINKKVLVKILESKRGKIAFNALTSSFASPGRTRISLTSIGRLYLCIPDKKEQDQLEEIDQKLLDIKFKIKNFENNLWEKIDQPKESIKDLNKIINQKYQKETRDELDIRVLPFPLASILQTVESFNGIPIKMSLHIEYFFEALSQFLAIYIMSGFYINEEEFYEIWKEVSDFLKERKQNISLSTFGTWNIIFSLLTKKIVQDIKEEEGMKEVWLSRLAIESEEFLNVLTSKKLYGILMKAMKLRNMWRGHSGAIGDDNAKERYNTYNEMVKEVLNLFGNFWLESPLVIPGENTFKKGKYNYFCQCAMGVTMPLPRKEYSLKQPLEDGMMHIVSTVSGKSCRLLPLIKFGESPSKDNNACYFYNRRDNDQSQRWISYHNENKPERPFSDPEVNTLLDKLSN